MNSPEAHVPINAGESVNAEPQRTLSDIARAAIEAIISEEDASSVVPDSFFEQSTPDGLDDLEDHKEPNQDKTEASAVVYMGEVLYPGPLPDLITPDQEKELAVAIEIGLFAQNKLDAQNTDIQASTYDEETIELLKEVADSGKEAKASMVESNLRLVISIAVKYRGWGLELTDLVQEGNNGLIKAVERFDYTQNARFATYAIWGINEAIYSAVLNQGRQIRIPVGKGKALVHFHRVQRDLRLELGKEPSSEELALRLEISKDRVNWLLDLDKLPVSLNREMRGSDGDGKTELGYLLTDPDTPTPEDIIAERQNLETITEYLIALIKTRETRTGKVKHWKDIAARSLQMIILYKGLGINFADIDQNFAQKNNLEFGKQYSSEEIGAMYDISANAVRRICSKGLRQLRNLGQREGWARE